MRPHDHAAQRPLWSAEHFPAGVGEALRRLRDRVEAAVGPDGAVRAPCCSRTLESALTLRLLDRTGLDPERRRAVTEYLHRCSSAGSPLDRALADAALGRRSAPVQEFTEDVVMRSPEFTGARKRALLDAFAAVCGHPPAVQPHSAMFSLDGLHCWAVVQVIAAKVILAVSAGRDDLVSDEDVWLLVETQHPGYVWEGNVLLHLWVLHALHLLPGTGRLVADGIAKLVVQQRADGGIPFITDTDTWCTATAGLALAAAGAPRTSLDRTAAYLLAQQRPAGGWAYTDLSWQTDVDDTSVAVQFLHILGPHRPASSMTRGIRSLYATRNSDGGFPTYVKGAPSEPSMTAAALDALTAQRDRHAHTIDDGLRFLAERQCDNGAFPPDWSASRFHTLFRVVLVATRDLDDVPHHVERMTRRALALVLDQQNDDGGWGQQEGDPSDPLSTAYALMALCAQDDPVPTARAATYLLAHQDEDGGIPSTPDSIGPRPFVFTIPALADIFSLLALAHLAGRIEGDVENRVAGQVPATRTTSR